MNIANSGEKRSVPEMVLRGQAPVEREEPRDVVDRDDLGRRGGGPQEGIVLDEAHLRPRRLLLSDQGWGSYF